MSLSLEEFNKAIVSLEKALDAYSGSASQHDQELMKIFRDACIQRFEYCIELAWKTSMKVLGSNTLAAKPAVREMARNNLIANPEAWLEFIDARNDTSHSYDEGTAQKVFKKIESFYPEAHKLAEVLKKII